MNTSRRSVFSTHRGKTVKRVILGAGSFALALIVVAGVTGGTHSSASAAATAAVQPVPGAAPPRDPVVVATVANPRTKAQQELLGSGVDRDPLTNRNIVRIRTQDVNDNTAATQVAQKVAVAWGTYSHSMSAQQFVASLPNVSPGADAAMLNAVRGQWPMIQSKSVDSTAKLTGVTPIVQTLNEKQGVATVSVKVDQSRTGEVDTSTKTVTFVVQMSRFEVSRQVPPDGTDSSKPVISNTAWGVIGVRQQ